MLYCLEPQKRRKPLNLWRSFQFGAPKLWHEAEIESFCPLFLAHLAYLD